MVVSEVAASDLWDLDMARDGRLRLELFIALEALEAADDMVFFALSFSRVLSTVRSVSSFVCAFTLNQETGKLTAER